MDNKKSHYGKGCEIEKETDWVESRVLPTKLSLLRQKLNQKAKREPKFRFYALYDRIYRKDVLWTAWKQVKENKGAPGVDGITIDQIVNSEAGPEGLVKEIHDSLKNKEYRPQPVLRVFIEKPGGKQRPLGIPTVRDRVVQTAFKLILEPIFEADFHDCSYGFRPRRSAHDALGAVRDHLKSGFKEVYDLDLAGYFDTIPHDKLMKALKMRISDRSVLKIIKLWLNAVIVDEKGRHNRPGKGTPQGGVISPLLSNIYLHWFECFFYMKDGPSNWANAKIVRYADDALILARYQGSRIKGWIKETLEDRMGLTINRKKTKVVKLKQPGARLNFLGFTYWYKRDLKGKPWKYLNLEPSKSSVQREKERLKEKTGPRMCFKPIPKLIKELNRHLIGWAQYYDFGYPSEAFKKINYYTGMRLKTHLKRRSQRPYHPPTGVRSFYEQLTKLGLVRI